jgi:hypothetical protein
MPKVWALQNSANTNEPVFKTANGAANVTFKHLEFRNSSSGGGPLLRIGNNSTQVLKSQMPDSFTVEYCFFNGWYKPVVGQRRGIELHGTNMIVRHSVIRGGTPHWTSNDSVGVWMCNGNGPFLIHNNEINGWTESFLTAGDDIKAKTAATQLATPTPTTGSCRVTITNSGDIPVVGQVLAVSVNAGTKRRHPLCESITLVSGSTRTTAPSPTTGSRGRWRGATTRSSQRQGRRASPSAAPAPR